MNTKLNEITSDSNGNLFVECILTNANGDNLSHRTSILLGGNVATQFAAINQHIVSEGYLEVSPEDLATITLAATEQLTPDRVSQLEATRLANIPSLQTVKDRKLASINQSCTNSLDAIKTSYPTDEVQSWGKQETEARAVTANSSTPTPLLTAIATARGITVADLASRVIEKADAFAVLSGGYIGTRQKLEGLINAATTVDQVDAISWPT